MSYPTYGLTIERIGENAHKTAIDHGWWESERNFGEILALIHSEVSEALEAWRDRLLDTWYREDGKPEGVTSEFADIIIRVCETAEAYNLPLEKILREKLRFNESRPYRHGGKHA